MIHIIDGRTGLRGHGSGMPVWGAVYKHRLEPAYGEYGAEMVIRGRVLSLAYLVESLQE